MTTTIARWYMTDTDKLLSGGTLDRLSKWGPAWLLVFLMIAGFGYGVWSMGNRLVPALTEYVTASREIDQQNAKHVAVLMATQEVTSQEHAAMLAGMQTLQAAIELRHEEHEVQSANLDKLLALIESATITMSNVPQQRAEQLKLLSEIRAGIEELKTSIESNGVHDASPDNP